MEYMPKNYSTDGGDKWVVGGTLEVAEGATVTGIADVSTLPTAAADVLGCVKVGDGLTITDGVLSADGITPAANQEAVEATAELADVITAFNALLTALETAGLMATE